MDPSQPSSVHTFKRSDILAVALFLLGVGMTRLILTPEWGVLFVIAGVGGLILYFALWRTSNPTWLNKALMTIAAVFVVASGGVIALKLIRPLPRIAGATTPVPPTSKELAKEFSRAQQEYNMSHPATANTAQKDIPTRSSVISSNSGTAIGTIQAGAVVSIGQQGGETAATIINNPPPSPNASITTYDYNGGKRTSAHSGEVEFGEEGVAFQKMSEMEKSHQWLELSTYAEEWIIKTPGWLTSNIFAAEALVRTEQQKVKACEHLRYVDERTKGNRDYDIARKMLLRDGCP
jgi:hypothetical protein